MKKTVIKDTREKRGLTQVQIAKKVGTSEVNYQRIERGVQEPGVGIAIRIADALGVENLRELFDSATSSEPKEP